MSAMNGTVRRLYDGVALSYGMTMVVLGSTIPSGLYSIYQRDWGLGSSSTVVFFSFYVVGVVIALLFGHVSDTVGRKPVILTCIALSLASSATFTLTTNFPGLCIARTLSGLSVGLCTGAFTAALQEAISPALGALLSTIYTSLSLALGLLFGAFIALHSGLPLRIPFIIYGILTLVAGALVLLITETLDNRGRLRLKVQIGVPKNLVAAFIPFAVAIGVAYGTNGLFQSVVPLSMKGLGVSSQLGMASTTFLMLAVSAATQIGMAFLPREPSLAAGMIILVVGLGSTAVSLIIGASVVAWFGICISGVGQGISFRTSLAGMAELSPRSDKAKTVSTYYVVGYVATAVPALAAGIVGGQPFVVAIVCAIVAAFAISNVFLLRSGKRL